MKITGWLVGMALMAGAPVEAGAAVRAKAHVVTAKAKTRKVVRRARVVRPRVAAVPPVVAPPLLPVPPTPAATPIPPLGLEGYRWLDDADAMMTAVGGSRPDIVFAVDRDARYAWMLNDGGLAIAEPLGPSEQRWYFFEPDVTVPFLVRDVGRSFAFDRGRLAAVYDREGTLTQWRTDAELERQAMTLFDRGRQLWFAARSPRPLPAREEVGPWWGQFVFGGDLGWRVNSGWGAYRDRDRGHRDRDDRYRRERESRQARGDRWHPAASMGMGYWSRGTRPGDSGSARPGGAERPPVAHDRPETWAAQRPGHATPTSAPATPVAVPGSPEPTPDRPWRRARAAEAPAAAAPIAAAPVPAPSSSSEPVIDRVPRHRPMPEVVAEPRGPDPAPAPRAAPTPEPPAPPRAQEPEPVRAAPPAQSAEPATERPRERQQHGDERPE